MTKLIIAFRNFANAPKKTKTSQLYSCYMPCTKTVNFFNLSLHVLTSFLNTFTTFIRYISILLSYFKKTEAVYTPTEGFRNVQFINNIKITFKTCV
jgi:hypothetical protein